MWQKFGFSLWELCVLFCFNLNKNIFWIFKETDRFSIDRDYTNFRFRFFKSLQQYLWVYLISLSSPVVLPSNFFKMEIQLKQEKQHTLKIKVSCSRKLCTISCSRYGEVGQWLYTVTTIFRNEGYRIEDSMNETRSIRTIIDCVKTYHQFYKKK